MPYSRAALAAAFRAANGREPTADELDRLAGHPDLPATTVALSSDDAGRAYDHDAGLARVYRDALAAGLGEEGARAAVAVAQTEGGMGGALGDGGRSGGTFQLYMGGGQGNGFAAARGLTEAQALDLLRRDPHAANQWALAGYLGQAIKRGLALGLTGPDLATYAQRTGQVSVSPERAGQNHAALFGNAGTQRFLEANAPGESTTIVPKPRHTEIGAVPTPEQPGAVPDTTGKPATERAETPEEKALKRWLAGQQMLDAYSRRLMGQFEEPRLPAYQLPGLPTIDLGWRRQSILPGVS